MACAEPAGNLQHAQSGGFRAVCAIAFCVSTAATIYFCRSMMGGMEMPGDWTMSMMWMRMPGQTWFTSASMSLLMWLVMMVAMMLPSAIPMLNQYRHWFASEQRPSGLTFMVAAGYFTVWVVVGLVTYVVAASWGRATMRSPGLSQRVPLLMGAALVISGLAQFSRWKLRALERCRDPLVCPGMPAAARGQKTAWRHGLSQGAACAICCSGPMLALVTLGAMDIIVMAVVAAVITIEKLAARPELVARYSGAAAVIGGFAVIMLRMVGP